MINRRHFIVLAAIPLTGLGTHLAKAAGVSRMTAYAFTFKGLDGDDIPLSSYAGHPLLVVNTASQCGYTPQYAGLQKIWTRYRERGLIVLGVPSNDFGGQEPGTNEQIKEFCSSKYSVTFPLFDKIDVNGANRHPLYVALAGEKSPFPGDIKWNFGKFLVSRDGKIIKRFEPKAAPDSKEVSDAIETALAAK